MMTRILKPLILSTHERLIEIFSDFLTNEKGLNVLGQGLGGKQINAIDILATDKDKLYITTVNTSDFRDAVFRSILSYGWYKENKNLIERLFASFTGLDKLSGLEPNLAIFSATVPVDIYSTLKELFSVPVQIYRYTLFGTETSPEIFVEEMDSKNLSTKPNELDPDMVKKELGIKAYTLTDEEIKEFLEIFRE